MRPIALYPRLIASIVLVVWGAEFLPRLIRYPDHVVSWIGALMMLAGTILAIRTVYMASRGAIAVGITFLLFTALYAWNMHYYFDSQRGSGTGPSADAYVAPALLLSLGIFFSVFFRYLYSKGAAAPPRPSTADTHENQAPLEIVRKTPDEPPHVQASTSTLTPLLRLALLACSAAVALVAARLLGVEDGATRAQVFLGVLVFGCLATGLISEETLIKIFPWQKK